MSDQSLSFDKTTHYRRWSISRTAKNGWQPSDMTIAATYQEGREPEEETMRGLARRCAVEAQGACDELNGNEQQVERFTTRTEN